MTVSLSDQHGVGFLHLLHGRLRHNPQLLHQNGDRVPPQAQAVWAGSAWGTELPGSGGVPLLPGPLPPVHLQHRGGLPRPRGHGWNQSRARCRGARSLSEIRSRSRTGQDESHISLHRPGGEHRLSGGGAVLNSNRQRSGGSCGTMWIQVMVRRTAPLDPDHHTWRFLNTNRLKTQRRPLINIKWDLWDRQWMDSWCVAAYFQVLCVVCQYPRVSLETWDCWTAASLQSSDQW